jgi:hypothetical protein
MGSSLTNYETFVLTIGYIAFILFLLTVIGIGGILTIIAAGIALVGYYPIKLYRGVDHDRKESNC